MKIIKVPVTGEVELVNVDSMEYPNLANATVGEGNLIERVFPRLFRLAREERIADGRNWFVMIVNEEGIRQGLPENVRASLLYGFRDHGGRIYGDAWVIGEGYTEDGPDFVELDADITVEVVEAMILLAAVIL